MKTYLPFTCLLVLGLLFTSIGAFAQVDYEQLKEKQDLLNEILETSGSVTCDTSCAEVQIAKSHLSVNAKGTCIYFYEEYSKTPDTRRAVYNSYRFKLADIDKLEIRQMSGNSLWKDGCCNDSSYFVIKVTMVGGKKRITKFETLKRMAYDKDDKCFYITHDDQERMFNAFSTVEMYLNSRDAANQVIKELNTLIAGFGE